jgi:choline dehydrogenase-like flavoprotein
MFLDARNVDEGQTIHAGVCIVGGGIAGIALALEFERRGIDCVVLESGGFSADDATRDLYRGKNLGLPYVFADGCRSRYLGGSSNCWGGWCRPLRELDMERRDWVQYSGWPFGLSELQPYYERVHRVLRLGPINDDIATWVDAIGRNDVRRIPLPSGRVEDIVSQFSWPLRLGAVYRGDLKRAKCVRTFLNANVVEFATDATAQRVTRVHVKTLSGRSFGVEAKEFVLACGGIENARLLLASNKTQAAGLGNANDLVGRFFADHPRLSLGNVRFKRPWKRNKLYDAKFHYFNRAVRAHGTFVSAQFAIAPEVQKRERLLSSQLWFSSIFPGENTRAAEAVVRMKHRLQAKADPVYGFWRDLATLATSPVSTAGFVAARIFQPEFLIKGAQIDVICEPSPNRESRVTLSNARDALGLPRVQVDWRLGEDVKRTIDRSVEILADELREANVAEVEVPDKLEGRQWPYVPATPWHHLGTWHHMGTTRMHVSPKEGVVDRDCKIHGMANLHVAGSSVFPSFGANFPTFTLVTLSLRLADQIVKQLAMC